MDGAIALAGARADKISYGMRRAPHSSWLVGQMMSMLYCRDSLAVRFFFLHFDGLYEYSLGMVKKELVVWVSREDRSRSTKSVKGMLCILSCGKKAFRETIKALGGVFYFYSCISFFSIRVDVHLLFFTPSDGIFLRLYWMVV